MEFKITEYTVTMDEIYYTVYLASVGLDLWQIHIGNHEIILNSNLDWVDFKDRKYTTRFTLAECNDILIRFVEEFRVKSL